MVVEWLQMVLEGFGMVSKVFGMVLDGFGGRLHGVCDLETNWRGRMMFPRFGFALDFFQKVERDTKQVLSSGRPFHHDTIQKAARFWV